MIVNDIGMLAIANNRSRSYLQNLVKKKLLPAFVILLKADTITPGQKSSDLSKEFEDMLKEYLIEYCIIPTVNVNSEIVIEKVKSLELKYLIYSGPGGAILGKELLGAGKKFIHVHPGRLPDFRGSTTVYYHILKGDTCGASAIFLEDKIDSGPILYTKDFDLPFDSDCDLDYGYDPKIRSEVLVDLIESYVKNDKFNLQKQNVEKGETYFIMHPVLRHIARLKLTSNK